MIKVLLNILFGAIELATLVGGLVGVEWITYRIINP